MKNFIDIATWKRRDYYNFFSTFADPFYSVSANVLCTKAFMRAKQSNTSFFLSYVHASLAAANSLEELRCRIEGDGVACYSEIHASTTVLNKENLFSFAFLPFNESLSDFISVSELAIAKSKEYTSLNLDDDSNRLDVIHYSTIPWVSFTSITQARNLGVVSSVPKITFGKYFKQADDYFLPVSISVHHGLVDGYHIGLFFSCLEELMNG